jgi:hypothetical protein
MGATDFTSVACGKTPEAAFNVARENAAWEHGHGGYTGTIAEKSGFVLFTLPLRVSPSKLEGWVSQCYYLLDEEDEPYDLKWAQDAVKNAKPGTKRAAQKRLREVEGRIKQQKKEAEKFKREVGPHFALVQRMSRVYEDKWGPAVCVELRTSAQRKPYIYAGKPRRGESVYLFFGIASC